MSDTIPSVISELCPTDYALLRQLALDRLDKRDDRLQTTLDRYESAKSKGEKLSGFVLTQGDINKLLRLKARQTAAVEAPSAAAQ